MLGQADSTERRSEARPAGIVRAPVEVDEAARKGTFVVIAAYQEQTMVARVVEEVRELFPNVIVVDDGSKDQTADRARKAGARVLRHAINRGQGAALQTGIAYALRCGADVVVTFDADGQHDANDLPHLVEPIASGRADFALGSRFMRGRPAGVPLARRALLTCARAFTRWTSGLQLSDTHNGLRAFSRQAASRLDLQLDRMAHASELIDNVRRSGLPYEEVPVRVRYTEYSRAKGQKARDAFRVLADYVLGRIFS